MDGIFAAYKRAPLHFTSCTLLNGLAHLLPMMASQLSNQAIKHAKIPARTHAEGGQVEPMLGTFEIKHCFSSPILQLAGLNQ
jgi:hypothetical protein